MNHYKSVAQYGDVAFGTVTHTTAATADTIATLTADRRLLLFMNSLDKDCIITIDGVAKYALPAFYSFTLDLGSDALAMASGTVIGIYYRGVAPTVGNISVSAH